MTDTLLTPVQLGLAISSAFLATLGLFLPWIGFVSLVPLIILLRTATLWQALLYSVFVAAVPTTWFVWNAIPFKGGKLFELVVIVALSVIFGALMTVGSFLWRHKPTWLGLILFPAAVMLASWMVEQTHGRFTSIWALGMTEVPWVLQVSTLGSHLFLVGLLSLSSSLLALLWLERATLSHNIVPITLSALVIVGSLAFARITQTRLKDEIAKAQTITVAAIASDLGVSDITHYLGKDPRFNVDGAIEEYSRLVAVAHSQGARVVVLPEAHVFLTDSNYTLWREVISGWARKHSVYVVAGYYDLSANRNLAITLGPDGSLLADYEKQHPTPMLEPSKQESMPPSVVSIPGGMLSTAICFDMNFSDITNAVAQNRGLFAVPANDWREWAENHFRVAAWAAICSRSSLIRATTHGISSLSDPAGRVIARGSSFDGPTVIVADVPILAHR